MTDALAREIGTEPRQWHTPTVGPVAGQSSLGGEA